MFQIFQSQWRKKKKIKDYHFTICTLSLFYISFFIQVYFFNIYYKNVQTYRFYLPSRFDILSTIYNWHFTIFALSNAHLSIGAFLYKEYAQK